MNWLGANFAHHLYGPELRLLAEDGEEVDVRGLKTREVMNFVTEVWEPWHHCILIPSRRWNPWLALSESLWILAGRGDVAVLEPYNSHIGDYSDDGVSLYGAYGRRIFGQIEPLVARLRSDHSDRRAVLQIWDEATIASSGLGRRDLTAQTKDPPCNNMVYFKLRKNELHMTVICRSNDLHFGLFAVNLPSFGLLQEYIASRLGSEMGYQAHLSNSLHIYTGEARAKAITERMLVDSTPISYPSHRMAFTPGELSKVTHDRMSFMCSNVLEGMNVPPDWPPFLVFASEFLKQYREKLWDPKDLTHGEEFQDWIAAGQLFVDQVWK